MEFGSFLEFQCSDEENQTSAFETSISHAQQAEDFGMDSVWLAEFHFEPDRSVLSSPLIVASAIASKTSHIKIGTAVHILPLGHPLRIAEDTATVDHISLGRFQFGVGRSAMPGDFHGYNTPLSESRKRFFETLQIIVRAWTHEKFSFEGEFYSFEDVCLIPKPYQVPHPPIRVAATTTDTFPTIGSMGFPIFVGLRIAGLSQLKTQIDTYIESLRNSGHTGPPDIYLRIPIYVTDNQKQAEKEAEASFMHQFRRLGLQLDQSTEKINANPHRQKEEFGQQLSTMTWDQVMVDRVIVGTPEKVTCRLREMIDILNLSGVVAEFNAGELVPPDAIERSMRMFCEHVIPALR